jgi:hypothetical protein
VRRGCDGREGGGKKKPVLFYGRPMAGTPRRLRTEKIRKILSMKRHEVILVIGIMISGLVAGIIFQDNIGGVLHLAIDTLVIIVPFVVTGIVGILRIFSRKRLRIIIRYSILIGSSSILSVIIVIATVWLINKWKIDAVEAYVLRAVPILDQIKAQSGTYPSQLPTELIGKPPVLLRYYGSYTATSASFCFEYINEPAGWAGGEGALRFESSTRKWVVDR